jgi:hypothetical protein
VKRLAIVLLLELLILGTILVVTRNDCVAAHRACATGAD